MNMRMLIAKHIALPLFDYVKGLQVRKYYRFYKETLLWDRRKIEKYQLEKLSKLLKYAYQNVPFYRNRFEENNLTPDSIKTLDDLKKIPPLTRKNLQENLGNLTPINYGLKKCYKGSSSGSTGQPVVYYHDKSGISAGQAANYFGWLLSGWEIGEKGLHIWGNPRVVNVEWKRLSSKLKVKLFNHYKFPAYQLTEKNQFDELISILQKKKFDFLDGYTNALFLLAEYIKKKNIKIDRFKYILTTGENLQDFQRPIIEEILGPVYDGYGCGEINGVAYECKHCHNYHIIEPRVILEYQTNKEMDDGSMPLLITDLYNLVMPLIRYQNGDMAVPGGKNDCKIKFKTLKSISGRISDIIDLPGGGTLVVPSFFGSMLLKQVDGLLQYQIDKIANNKIIIKLVTCENFKNIDKNKIELSLQEYLKDKIEWQLTFVDEIPLSKSGKFKLLVDKTKGQKND